MVFTSLVQFRMPIATTSQLPVLWNWLRHVVILAKTFPFMYQNECVWQSMVNHREDRIKWKLLQWFNNYNLSKKVKSIFQIWNLKTFRILCAKVSHTVQTVKRHKKLIENSDSFKWRKNSRKHLIQSSMWQGLKVLFRVKYWEVIS